MKALIEREVERRELAGHIKLGPGGIREIEFIVQAFQLIRGGRERRLQTTSLLQALTLLGELQLHAGRRPSRSCARRICTCGGWRTACRCSLTARSTSLPADALLAASASRSPWAPRIGRRCSRSSAGIRRCVSGHFTRFVFGAAGRDGTAVRIDLGRLWDDGAESAVLSESLRPRRLRGARAGGADAVGSCVPRRWCASSMSPGGGACRRCCRRCLRTSAPPGSRAPSSSRCCAGSSRILEATGKRSAYFALLRESQPARSRLIEICRHGDFLAAADRLLSAAAR